MFYCILFVGDTIYLGFTQAYICHCITESWEVNSTHIVDARIHCTEPCRDMPGLYCGGDQAFSVWWLNGKW